MSRLKSRANRERSVSKPKEKVRDTEANTRWSLTHLVGQGHKRRCLPGLQWSMKPPGECNRRALEPPQRLLANQPANSLKGSGTTKATGCSDLPRCQVPGCQQKSLVRPPAVSFSFWSVPIEILSHERTTVRGEMLGCVVRQKVHAVLWIYLKATVSDYVKEP